MLFEVDSFFVAKNIDYVIAKDIYREPSLVVILPKNNKPLPTMVHGSDWLTVESFILVGFDNAAIKKYKALNAIILSVDSENITIIDFSGYSILELNCKYRDAVEYLEYLFQETY